MGFNSVFKALIQQKNNQFVRYTVCSYKTGTQPLQSCNSHGRWSLGRNHRWAPELYVIYIRVHEATVNGFWCPFSTGLCNMQLLELPFLGNVQYETGGIEPISILEPFRYLHGNEANVFHITFHYPLWDFKFPESLKLKATKENLLFVKASKRKCIFSRIYSIHNRSDLSW